MNIFFKIIKNIHSVKLFLFYDKYSSSFIWHVFQDEGINSQILIRNIYHHVKIINRVSGPKRRNTKCDVFGIGEFADPYSLSSF